MARLRVEVVYALPAAQDAASVEVTEGASARDALEASGFLARHPEIDLRRNRLAIFGREIRPDARLREGDRVEVLRPLVMDPKEARRLRARRKRR